MSAPKKILLLFLSLLGGCFFQTALGQSSVSNVPDPRLYEAFGSERVEFLQQSNPDLIRYYNFYLDNAFTLVQHPAEKVAGIRTSCPLLTLNSQTQKADVPDMRKGTKSINILKYKYQLSQDRPTQYRLDDSGIVIVFLPAREITEKYNAIRNK